MKAIDRYIELVDEILTLYQSYDIINLQLQGLDYIKDLQYKVQTFDIRNIESELIDDCPDQVQLKRRIDFLEMKLFPDSNIGYLVEFKISTTDWLGDSKKREKYFYNHLKKDGGEYVIRLHSILHQINQNTRKIIQMVEKLKPLAGIQKNDMGTANANQSNTILPSALNTDRARKYFLKALEAGIISQEGTKYHKKDISKAQLAYFLELVFCRDNDGKDNGKHFPEKELNKLFEESRLGKGRGQYLNNKTGKPIGFEIINRIFE